MEFIIPILRNYLGIKNYYQIKFYFVLVNYKF